MSSVFQKPGRVQWYARLKGAKIPGKWSDVPTGEIDRERAERFAHAAQKGIDKRNNVPRPDVLTLKAWIAKWLTKRAEAGHDWKKDRGRLDKHVLPVFGSAELAEVTTAMIADLVHDLRFKKKLANRTVRNIYSVLAAVFRDARIAGHVHQTPCILGDEQLGQVLDKDPEWRSSALFTRPEVESMISDSRIPHDRQLVYAFGLLAGLRPGEGAALRWKHYEMREPLGCLKVAKAYSTSHSKEKGTKTDAVRHVPVHPVLAEMLAQWRAIGWPTMFGGEPGPDDLIVPLPPDVKRTKRTGERFRGWDYTGRRWREVDLKALGWRHRSVYDTRATFITLALEDGADRQIIEERVTHTKPRRDAFDGYDRGERWDETCREVAKLRVRRLADVMLTVSDSLADSTTSGLRRRASNAQSSPLELRVIQGGREVIECSCHPEVASPSASLRTAIAADS
jgi:integrase